MTLRVCHKYSMDGKTPFHKYFGRILFPFHPPQVQNSHFLVNLLQCDMPFFSGSPTFGQGGGPACFYLLFGR